MNPDHVPTLIGAVVLAPSHLTGSRVTGAWIDRDGPEWNWSVELTLDREHPSFPGQYIGVTLDYVTLNIGET